MKKMISCLLLALALTVGTQAAAVPTETVVQNLNGSQQLIRTYTLPPDADPQELIEEPFELDGFLYSFADITKKDNLAADYTYRTETVTLETETDDLSEILEQLPPTTEYDDGKFSGVLALDHTSIRTVAAGYESKSRNVSAVKTIGPLDRSDLSYIPATTVKDGLTLKLSGVEWQVIGTELVGDVLTPSSYQAVATYAGKASYKSATGYVTTANYTGRITREGVESITYRLTYLGVESAKDSGTMQAGILKAGDALVNALPYILLTVGTAAIALLAVLLVRSRRELRQFREEDGNDEDAQEVDAT